MGQVVFFQSPGPSGRASGRRCKPLMTGACCAVHEERINGFLAGNEKIFLNRLAVICTDIIFVESDNQVDTVAVRLNAQCSDCSIYVGTGKVVTGSKAVVVRDEDRVFKFLPPDYLACGGTLLFSGLGANWRLACNDEEACLWQIPWMLACFRYCLAK